MVIIIRKHRPITNLSYPKTLQISKKSPNLHKNIYRPSNNNNPVVIPPGTYIPFSERVEQSPYLISLEQKNQKKQKKSKKKRD